MGCSQMPPLAKQQQIYTVIAKQVAPHPMVIRAFDYSTDKHPEFLDDKHLTSGLRGISWALQERRLLTTQLHAILRAFNECPNIKLLLPMVTNKAAILQIKKIMTDLADKKNLKVPPTGAMIETPLAVFSVQDFISEIDFASIGCNDLAQYMLGIDRQFNALNLHDWILEPALLRTFETLFNYAGEHELSIGVCGLAASDPLLAAVLVGLGARQLSVDPNCAPKVRYTLCHLGKRDARQLTGARNQYAALRVPQDIS